MTEKINHARMLYMRLAKDEESASRLEEVMKKAKDLSRGTENLVRTEFMTWADNSIDRNIRGEQFRSLLEPGAAERKLRDRIREIMKDYEEKRKPLAESASILLDEQAEGMLQHFIIRERSDSLDMIANAAYGFGRENANDSISEWYSLHLLRCNIDRDIHIMAAAFWAGQPIDRYISLYHAVMKDSKELRRTYQKDSWMAEMALERLVCLMLNGIISAVDGMKSPVIAMKKKTAEQKASKPEIFVPELLERSESTIEFASWMIKSLIGKREYARIIQKESTMESTDGIVCRHTAENGRHFCVNIRMNTTYGALVASGMRLGVEKNAEPYVRDMMKVMVWEKLVQTCCVKRYTPEEVLEIIEIPDQSFRTAQGPSWIIQPASEDCNSDASCPAD